MKTLMVMLAAVLAPTGQASADEYNDMKVWTMLFLAPDTESTLDDIGVSAERKAAFTAYAEKSKEEVNAVGVESVRAICLSEHSAEAVADTMDAGFAAINAKISERVTGLDKILTATELSALRSKASESDSYGAVAVDSPSARVRDGRINYEHVIERACTAR